MGIGYESIEILQENSVYKQSCLMVALAAAQCVFCGTLKAQVPMPTNTPDYICPSELDSQEPLFGGLWAYKTVDIRDDDGEPGCDNEETDYIYLYEEKLAADQLYGNEACTACKTNKTPDHVLQWNGARKSRSQRDRHRHQQRLAAQVFTSLRKSGSSKLDVYFDDFRVASSTNVMGTKKDYYFRCAFGIYKSGTSEFPIIVAFEEEDAPSCIDETGIIVLDLTNARASLIAEVKIGLGSRTTRKSMHFYPIFNDTSWSKLGASLSRIEKTLGVGTKQKTLVSYADQKKQKEQPKARKKSKKKNPKARKNQPKAKKKKAKAGKRKQS